MSNKLSFTKIMIAGLLAGIVSAVMNSILFLVCHSSGIISDNVYLFPYAPMTLARVVVASVVPIIVGSMVFFLMDGLPKNSIKTFSILTAIVVVVSLYSLYSITPGITPRYLLVLFAMHIITACSLLYFIRRIKLSKQQNLHYQTA